MYIVSEELAEELKLIVLESRYSYRSMVGAMLGIGEELVEEQKLMLMELRHCHGTGLVRVRGVIPVALRRLGEELVEAKVLIVETC